MNLAEYMTFKGLDDAAIGASVKKSRSRVSRYRRKLEAIPGDVVKILVEMSASDPVHAMTANELLGIEQTQAAE